MSDTEKPFLQRWSSRKLEQAEDEPEAVEGVLPKVEDAPEQTDAEILAEHGLPDPDALQPGDDITGFMKAAIPARLKNKALRKLWLGNPALANLDGLIDYGEDFTDAATVVENLETVYEVGRGMVKRLAEPEAETPEPLDAEDVQSESEAASESAELPDEPVPEEDTEEDGLVQISQSEDPAPAIAPSRRMQFHFDKAEEA